MLIFSMLTPYKYSREVLDNNYPMFTSDHHAVIGAWTPPWCFIAAIEPVVPANLPRAHYQPHPVTRV